MLQSLKDGCDKYALTREQLEQKRRKRKGTIMVEVEAQSDRYFRGTINPETHTFAFQG